MRRRTPGALSGATFLLVMAWAGPAAAQGPSVDARVAAALADISPQRMSGYLEALTDLGTRHSLSHSDRSDWGVDAARAYILDAFRGFSPRLQVSLSNCSGG